MFVVGVKQQQVLWKVYERTIAGNISYRGGFIPTGKAWDWYVVGRDGKRYKYLYLQILGPNDFSIGTRSRLEFNATYSRCCLSRRKGMAVRDARLLRPSLVWDAPYRIAPQAIHLEQIGNNLANTAYHDTDKTNPAKPIIVTFQFPNSGLYRGTRNFRE